MSLKDSWQQQRQQRQQEVTQRQQTVSESLTVTRQARQVKAAQLRHELSLFRDALASQSVSRRNELQQFCQRLHLETQSFLTVAGNRREIQAAQLAQALNFFVQVLQQQTAAFLTAAQAERAVAAQQLEQDLVAFVSDLRSDVQSYLIELEAVRENRAVQLSQTLVASRAKREAETQALFQRLAIFRTELRRFSQDLHSTVWGSDRSSAEMPAMKPQTPPQKPPQTAKNGTQLVGRSGRTNGAIALTSTVGAFQHGNSVAVAPPTKMVKAPQETIAHEKDVYAYIEQVQGARLTEIEGSLALNRVQVVDALQALIKKGLITQRDRIYLAKASLAHT